jgi:hypothetical protein
MYIHWAVFFLIVDRVGRNVLTWPSVVNSSATKHWKLSEEVQTISLKAAGSNSGLYYA